MALRDPYRAQIELLIRCLPAIASTPEFALKGGTAINLFLRDMPRLSVDIDLTYLPITDRDTALADIRSQLSGIDEALRRVVPGINVQTVGGDAPKLLVDRLGARIKIEPSVVMRGSLVPPIECELCPAAQDAYEVFVELQCLDSIDLYGGKLCAALDRHSMEAAQHSTDERTQAHESSGPFTGRIGSLNLSSASHSGTRPNSYQNLKAIGLLRPVALK